MRFCDECKKEFELKDALMVEIETIEPSGEGMFPWSDLKKVMKKIPVCPHCESMSHFSTIKYKL